MRAVRFLRSWGGLPDDGHTQLPYGLAMRSLNPELTEISIEWLRRRTSAKWGRYPEDVLPAWVAEMDFPLAAPVRDALIEAVERGDADTPGRRASASGRRLRSSPQPARWHVDPARVHPAPDVVAALRAVLREIAQPGDAVVINTPVYHPFFAVIEELGCRLVEAPLTEGQLDPEAVERCFADGAAALILCSPHNPMGSVPTGEQLAAIATAAGAPRRLGPRR